MAFLDEIEAPLHDAGQPPHGDGIIRRGSVGSDGVRLSPASARLAKGGRVPRNLEFHHASPFSDRVGKIATPPSSDEVSPRRGETGAKAG